jgi:hypothetical protein
MKKDKLKVATPRPRGGNPEVTKRRFYHFYQKAEVSTQ